MRLVSYPITVAVLCQPSLIFRVERGNPLDFSGRKQLMHKLPTLVVSGPDQFSRICGKPCVWGLVLGGGMPCLPHQYFRSTPGLSATDFYLLAPWNVTHRSVVRAGNYGGRCLASAS
jgi:hypothetical protein